MGIIPILRNILFPPSVDSDDGSAAVKTVRLDYLLLYYSLRDQFPAKDRNLWSCGHSHFCALNPSNDLDPHG